MDSRCRYFGLCNGCSCQNIDYALQLSNKSEYVKRKLEKIGVIVPTIRVFSDKPFNYRNRMDFIFNQGGIGFRGRSRPIIQIDRCEIADELVNLLLSEVKDFFGSEKFDIFNMRTRTGTMRYAIIRSSRFAKASSVIFSLNSDSHRLGEHIEAIKEFSQVSSAKNVIISRVLKSHDNPLSEDFFVVKGSEFIEESLLGIGIDYHALGFFQNNPAVAEMMVEHVRGIFEKEDTEDSALLDMYGGVGTFGLPLSGIFKTVVILESSSFGIDSAKRNIVKNRIMNSEAIQMDLSRMNYKKIEGKMRKKNYTIVDPPRTGLDKKAINFLLEADISKLVYVSCNPERMAKDLSILKKRYSIGQVSIFDQFPQTNHIEALAELKKNKQ